MSMFSERNELVVPINRAKLVKAALISSCFVLGGVWMLTLAPKGGAVGTIIGAASVIFFGLCGVLAIRRLIRAEPAVVINGEGILDNASGFGFGLIRWNEIAELQEYKFMGQIFLGVMPKDLDRLLASQSAWKRSMIRLNMALGAAPINIPQDILPVRVSELLREIGQRYQFNSNA